MEAIRRDLLTAAFVVALLPALLLMACQPSDPQEEPPPNVENVEETGTPCPDPPPCGNSNQPACTNTQGVPPDCWPTPHGPVQADVAILQLGLPPSPNQPLQSLLYCEPVGSYALCFFSGPPDATGTDTSNKRLPCVIDDKVDPTAADCTCQAYHTTGENSATGKNNLPYFVDLNGILNQGLYYETVNKCESDGSGCKNFYTCGIDGSDCTDSALPQAPVCDYINNQNQTVDTAQKFALDADLISTFSGAMNAGYVYQDKTSCPSNYYAGCMTASCKFVDGDADFTDGDPIQCNCPVVQGKFQLTQSNEQTCTLEAGFVWSASYTVAMKASQ